MSKVKFIRFYKVRYKTVLLQNVPGWPKTQREMNMYNALVMPCFSYFSAAWGICNINKELADAEYAC